MSPHEILTIAISAIGVVAAVVTGFIGYQNGLKKNSNKDGQERGVLMTEIGYIKAGIERIERQQERYDQDYKELNLRVNTIQNEQKTMWTRIDELKEEKKNV